ncbi:MAG TPA: DNA-directed RNA polymerase subunit alpha C-terminal domain-containing protein [Blastocatellia bacterium]|nr:DNA-directed RNA polymerase subunit alpha C-terminal domain-containing protein [Blastocatellia bacterium]
MTDQHSNNELQAEYENYGRQKCFVAHSHEAHWRDDILAACDKVLPQFDLEPWYAANQADPTQTLRDKVVELIANSRYGIYDLSYWKGADGKWHLPRNVLIELGVAIALNRPALLLRHKSNQEAALPLPDCLESVSRYILDFAGESSLGLALKEHLPKWLNAPPERDWWNRFCIFGNKTCDYRETHPRLKQWGQKFLRCHIADGPDVDRSDFRSLMEEILERFTDITYVYFDGVSLTKGYEFLLCSHCQLARSTSFAIYRITPNTPAESFIAIGMSIALEKQFGYKIPRILLSDSIQDVPSLLWDNEVAIARNDKKRKEELRKFIPSALQRVRETMWRPRPLPFVEIKLQSESVYKQASEDVSIRERQQRAAYGITMALDELGIAAHTYNALEKAGITTVRKLVRRTKADLLKLNNFGGKSLAEIIGILDPLGLRLGMPPSEVHELINIAPDQFRDVKKRKKPKATAFLDQLSMGDPAISKVSVIGIESLAGTVAENDTAIKDEIEQALRKVLKGRHRDRDVLIFKLRFYEGLTFSEIIKVLNLDLSTVSVSSIVNRIIHKIKPILSRTRGIRL